MDPRLALVLALGLGACNGGDPRVVDPIESLLYAEDQTLPTALVGQPYDAALTARGGRPPYAWFLENVAEVPIGLVVDGNGHLVGRPAVAGQYSFNAVVLDSAGRRKFKRVNLAVDLDADELACGGKAAGTFGTSGWGPGVDPDWSQPEGHDWLTIAVPDDDTTRIEIAFDGDGSMYALVGHPGRVVGSGEVERDYAWHFLNPRAASDTLTIDLGTTPSLSGYAEQDVIPLLLVANEPGTWSADVSCSDGPIFVRTSMYPEELGVPLDVDFDIYGDNSDVRIWTDAELPSWMQWDEQTGIVSGDAEDHGAWEFTIHAETSDGRRRSEDAIIGVYRVQDLQCGDSYAFTTPEDYNQGRFNAYFDPRGFQVFRVPVDPLDPPSAIDLKLRGPNGLHLGLAEPDPEWLKFWGGAQREYVTESQITIGLHTDTYPTVSSYGLHGELYAVAASTTSMGTDLNLQVVCDASLAVAFPALPVLQPQVPADHQLEAVGGVPPYTWSATGLPAGVTLTPDGRLQSANPKPGTTAVTVTLTDEGGGQFISTYDLHVGDDAACAGARLIACDDRNAGVFDTPYYYEEVFTAASTEVLCFVKHQPAPIGFSVASEISELRLNLGDPGATIDELLYDDRRTYMGYVARGTSEPVDLGPTTFPYGPDYDHLPVLLSIQAYDAGPWEATLYCPEE